MTEVQEASRSLVRGIVEEAVAIAACVPQALQPTAFAKACDLIANFVYADKRPAAGVKAQPRRGAADAEGEKQPRKTRTGGPKSFVEKILDAGFLDEGRSVEAVAEHINLNFARTFASKDLSTTLIRLVQEGKLRREKTPEGKLLYRKS